MILLRMMDFFNDELTENIREASQNTEKGNMMYYTLLLMLELI